MTSKKNWQQRQQEIENKKMFIKTNHIVLFPSVNKFGTCWQQVATKMLPVLPAKTSALSTNQCIKTRANTGFYRNVAKVAAVATCKATSLHSLFKTTPEASQQ